MRGLFFSRLLLSLSLTVEAFGAATLNIISNAQPVQNAEASFAAAKTSLSYHSMSINHSTNAWEGKHWHYRVSNPVTNNLEEFTIYVVDHEFPDNDTDSAPLLHRSEQINSTDLEPRAWVCDWVYGCVNAVTYATAISLDQMIAVGNAINDRLRANDNQLMNRLFDGVVVGMSIAIVATPIQYFITNKMQQDSQSATDVCVTKGNWEQTVALLRADLDDLRKAIQAGDSRPKTYNHRSDNAETQQNGHSLVHAVKTTQSSSDFNPLQC